MFSYISINQFTKVFFSCMTENVIMEYVIAVKY